MVDVTLLEVNLEGSEFTANAPFSSNDGKSKPGRTVSKMLPGSSTSKGEKKGEKGEADGEESDDDASTEPVELDIDDADEEEGSSPPITPLVALVVLVAVALVVRKLRGGDSDADVEDFE